MGSNICEACKINQKWQFVCVLMYHNEIFYSCPISDDIQCLTAQESYFKLIESES